MLAANSVHAQWAPDVRLTNDPFSSNISVSNSHCIAASNDTLHVVWYDNRDGNFEIYYKRSTDGGATWESDTRMTTNSFLSYDPCIVLSGPVLHLFWGDSRDGNREIYYKRSLNGGNNWGADIRLTNAIRASESPSAAISDSVIHLTWYDERDDPSGNWYTEIYYKRSTDLGLTWGPDFRLTEKSAYAGFPCIAVAGQTVHIVWEDMRNGDYDVYYKRSTDGGLSWGLDTLLTNSLADQSDPCITVSDSVVYVVWHDSRDGNQEIYYKRSADGGITWGVDTRLTNNSGYSEYPTLAVSGSNVHVVWDDNRDANFEIYYKRSLDGGLTWGADTRLTNA
ncbi:MAG: exo-alpha-sialidase, partial [Bacteroidetes bacterium]